MHAFTSLLIVFLLQTATQAHEAPIRIMGVGAIETPNPVPVSGEKWLALFCREGRSDLLERTIKVTSSGHSTHLDISINDSLYPVILIHPDSRMRAGKLTTATWTRGNLNPSAAVILHMGGRKYRLNANADTVEDGFGNYHLWLSDGKRKQRIVNRAKIISGSIPRILWAGDLDRDGELDLLLDLRFGEVGSEPTLFLSNGTNGELVRRAAWCLQLG